MYCMGQDQTKGVELEDKMVESQPYGDTRTIKVPQTCSNVSLTYEEFELFRCSNFRELLRYSIVISASVSTWNEMHRIVLYNLNIRTISGSLACLGAWPCLFIASCCI